MLPPAVRVTFFFFVALPFAGTAHILPGSLGLCGFFFRLGPWGAPVTCWY